MKIKWILLTLCLIAFPLHGEAMYKRKSISAPPQLWLHQDHTLINPNQALHVIKTRIQSPRFDQNSLPDSLYENLYNQPLNINNPEAFQRQLETYLMTPLKKILNDPNIQQKRVEALKNNQKVSFAQTKGKSIALTIKELTYLMNSAYIYIPYITHTEENKSRTHYDFKLQGGILWYQLQNDGYGKTQIKLIKKIETNGQSRQEYIFFIPPEEIHKKAQDEALSQFATNAEIKTRQIDEFRLVGRVEAVNNSAYTVPLSRRDGLQLDHRFFLMELQEIDGKEQETEVGYIQFNHIGETQNDPSLAVQRLGGEQSAGGWVKEHPLLGLDIQISGATFSGYQLTNQDTVLNDFIPNNLEQSMGLSIDFAYNTAPYTQISQLFIIGKGALFLPENTQETTATLRTRNYQWILLSSFGVMKKVWLMGNQNIQFSAGIESTKYEQEDTISIFYTRKSTLEINGLNLIAGLGYEWLIAPQWSLAISTHIHSPIGKLVATRVDDKEDIQLNHSTLGGISFKIGLSYALETLEF